EMDAQAPVILYPNGGTAGGQIGCDVQFGGFVLGVEGDGQWVFDSKVSRAFGYSPPLGDTLSKSFENPWFATAQVRAGVALDRTLLYVTGGGAFAGVKTTDTLVTAGGLATSTVNTDKAMIGWTVGGGIEQALTPHWTVKAEYLYSELGTLDVGIPC